MIRRARRQEPSTAHSSKIVDQCEPYRTIALADDRTVAGITAEVTGAR